MFKFIQANKHCKCSCFGAVSPMGLWAMSLLLACNQVNVGSSAAENSKPGSSSNEIDRVPEMISEKYIVIDKVDILFSVDSAMLTSDQQKEIDDSIRSLLEELDARGVDYHVGLVGAGSVAPGAAFPLPGIGVGMGGDADWLGMGLGTLTLLGGHSRYLTAEQKSMLQADLIGNVMVGIQNQLGSQTRGKFEQNILPLLPVIVSAAQQGAAKKDLSDILNSVAPLIYTATQKGQLGGNYNQAIRELLPIVEMAFGGGLQGQGFENILAAALPIAISLGLNSSTSNEYVSAASVVLPVVLQLANNPKKNAGFDDLFSMALPLILAQVGHKGNNDYLRIAGLVIPMVNTAMNVSKNGGKLDAGSLFSQLLPVALSEISNQGASHEYTYILSALMPVVLEMLQDKNGTQNSNKVLNTVSQIGLATVLSALDKNKIAKGGVNEGFLRQDALLQIVLIGEKVVSGHSNPKDIAETFVNLLLERRLGQTENTLFDAILGGDRDICSASLHAEAHVYKEIASLLGGGVADLCDNSQSVGNQLVANILSKLTEYPLGFEPYVSTVKVLIDGVEIPNSFDNGWSLSLDRTKIAFTGTYIPSAGSEVTVMYVPKG